MEELPNLAGQRIKTYQLLNFIDRGGFGAVYLVEDTETRKRYAMKILYPNEKNEMEYNQEVAVYDLLSSVSLGCNKHIVCLHEAFVHNIIIEDESPGDEMFVSDDMYYILVLELMEGDIRDIIDSKLAINNAYIILNFMKGLLEGLESIHSKGIAHNDIKLENILYKTDIVMDDDVKRERIILKFVDFGLSCTDETHPELLKKIRKCEIEGNPTFMSQDYAYAEPDEITLELAQKDDIWALGVVFRIVAVGRHPIKRINELIKRGSTTEADIMRALRSATYVEKFEYNTGDAKLDSIIEYVIRKMSALDEEDRPTAQELLNYIYENE